MSVSAVLTQGFGNFGSVNLLPTLGYSSVAVIVEDYTIYAAYTGPLPAGPVPAYRHKSRSEEVDEEIDAEIDKLNADISALQATYSESEYNRIQSEISKIREEKLALSTLESQNQAEIRRLFEEKSRLIRRVKDEEESLLVLFSLPFVH